MLRVLRVLRVVSLRIIRNFRCEWNAQLQVTTLDPVTAADGVSNPPEYTLRVFVVRYNVLRLMGGGVCEMM